MPSHNHIHNSLFANTSASRRSTHRGSAGGRHQSAAPTSTDLARFEVRSETYFEKLQADLDRRHVVIHPNPFEHQLGVSKERRPLGGKPTELETCFESFTSLRSE